MSSQPIPLESGPDLETLRPLVARYAADLDRYQHLLPWLRFYRHERPASHHKGCAPMLWVGVIVQGKKRMSAGGRDLICGPGSYLVLSGDYDFASHIVEASPGRPYLSLGVSVSPELIVETWSALVESGLSQAAGEPEPMWISQLDQGMIDALVRILRCLADPAEQRVIAPLALKELVFRLLRSDAAGALRRAAQRDGDVARIRQAMGFIERHARERLTVARVAREVAMSPSHFAHRFREVARVSPMRYQKNVRLHQARTLLSGGGLRPSEVATKVGYASAAQFARDFKSSFEVPPSEYARRFRT